MASYFKHGEIEAIRLKKLNAVYDLASSVNPHAHPISEITGLQNALDNKLDDTQATAHGLALLGSASAAESRTTLGLGTAATKDTSTSGNNVPLLDGTNTWSAAQAFGAITATNITASGSISIGTGGTYGPGMIYSDANWGMLFRAKQASPAIAQFRWRDSADTDIMSLTSTALTVPSATTASAANVHQASSGSELLRSTSSGAYKYDIELMGDDYADALLGANAIWFRSTSDADNPNHSFYGFLAEEIADIDPRFVHYAFQEDQYEEVEVEPASTDPVTGETTPARYERRVKAGEVMRPDGVQYDRFVAPLHHIAKRHDARLDIVEARLAAAGIA